MKSIPEISNCRVLMAMLMTVGIAVASFAIACGGTETVVVPEETVIVEKEVEVEKFVEIEVEKVVVQTVVVEREIQVAGDTVVQTVVVEKVVIREVEKEVVREVQVEIPVEVEKVVEVEVVREVMVVATPTPASSPTPGPTETPVPTATPSPTLEPPSSPAELVERVQDSIVRIRARSGGTFFGTTSQGSGFIFAVEGTTAFVATNHHIIDGRQLSRSSD